MFRMCRNLLKQTPSTAPQHPAPEVYTVAPPQPTVSKPGQLKKSQLEQYFNEGFLVVPNFFTSEEMKPVVEVLKTCYLIRCAV